MGGNGVMERRSRGVMRESASESVYGWVSETVNGGGGVAAQRIGFHHPVASTLQCSIAPPTPFLLEQVPRFLEKGLAQGAFLAVTQFGEFLELGFLRGGKMRGHF